MNISTIYIYHLLKCLWKLLCSPSPFAMTPKIETYFYFDTSAYFDIQSIHGFALSNLCSLQCARLTSGLIHIQQRRDIGMFYRFLYCFQIFIEQQSLYFICKICISYQLSHGIVELLNVT